MRRTILAFILSFQTSVAFLNHPFHVTNKEQLPLQTSRYTTRGEKDSESEECSNQRRNVLKVLAGATVGFATASPASWAGEVGARITKAVTTSDLGISVRTSVVKGAQVMDQIDGRWEKFSDRFGLGAERSKQGQRPKPKTIPDPLPLDVGLAQTILSVSDQEFLSLTGIQPKVLEEQIAKVANLVKVSYERSGLALNSDNPLTFTNGPQFNFAVYAHFKAYSDLIVEQKINFAPFRTKFEQQVGKQLAKALQPSIDTSNQASSSSLPSDEKRQASLEKSLAAIDDLCNVLQRKGLVALVERSTIDQDSLYDWIDEVSDLEFTIALDGDITLDAQILLQEQGFRLYPNFARYIVVYWMQTFVASQKVSAMDYYFDTDYNSDPDKFEVKEVLLSVSVES